MAAITRARAFCDNEVAYLAWRPGLRRFPTASASTSSASIFRRIETVQQERPLNSYVAFKGHRNVDWLPQNTSVWPIQKFTRRDLTLRKLRDKAVRRTVPPKVRYRIGAVGPMRPRLDPVEVVPDSHVDPKTKEYVPQV